MGIGLRSHLPRSEILVIREMGRSRETLPCLNHASPTSPQTPLFILRVFGMPTSHSASPSLTSHGQRQLLRFLSPFSTLTFIFTPFRNVQFPAHRPRLLGSFGKSHSNKQSSFKSAWKGIPGTVVPSTASRTVQDVTMREVSRRRATSP